MPKSYSRFALLFFTAAVVLRFMMLFFSLSFGVIGFYVCAALGIIMLGADAMHAEKYAKAFDFDSQSGLNVFSALVSIGFFTDFIYSGFSLIKVFENDVHTVRKTVIYLMLCAVLDILACFYYIVISFSYARGSYDFRQLKLFHFVPLLWIVLKSISVLSDVVNLTEDVDGIIKVAVLAVGILSFYCFISEIDNDTGAKNISVFAFNSFSYMSFLHFFSGLMLLISGRKSFDDEIVVSGLVFLFLGIFTCFFKRNIISRTR